MLLRWRTSNVVHGRHHQRRATKEDGKDGLIRDHVRLVPWQLDVRRYVGVRVYSHGGSVRGQSPEVAPRKLYMVPGAVRR